MDGRKIAWLIPIVGLVSGAAIISDAGSVVSVLISFLPSHAEHSYTYNADLIRLLGIELIWVSSFFVFFLLLKGSGGFSRWFTFLTERLVRNPNHTVTLVLASYLAIAAIIAVVVLRTFPNSADEYAYIFQAVDLHEGKLWSPVHASPDFFEFDHIPQKENKWLSRFPPGWPLVLSLAMALSLPPWLVNVAIGLFTLFFLYKLVRKIYDEEIAIWSLLGVAATSFFLFNAASYFSHMVSLLQLELAMYFTLHYFETRKNAWAVLAGVFVGLLAITRPYTAVLLLGIFYGWILLRKKREAVVPLAFVAAGALPFILLLFWYNYHTTGNAFLPVTMWAYPEEKLGFTGDHTITAGLKHILKRLLMFVYWVSPHFLILYVISIVADLKKKGHSLAAHPENYFFLALIAGYMLYYSYGGNQYGPRFYFEAFPFLVVFLTVNAIRQTGNWGRVILVTGMLFAIVRMPFISARENRIVNERMDVYDQVAKLGIQNAVVMIASPTGTIRPMDQENLNRNDKDYRNTVLYALDLGEKNEQLMRLYPERRFFRYERDPEKPEGRLVEIQEGYSTVATGDDSEE